MRRFLAILAAGLLVFAAGCAGGSSGRTDKSADDLLSVVLNSVQFPQTLELDDESRITDELGIDLSLVDDYAIVQQMLSVDVSEVVILIAKDGAADRLQDALEARKQSLINDFAFYPNQVAAAEATEVGSVKNVVFLICHEEAATARERLIEAITGA